jgi:signal transduction histidine kinase
VPTPRVLAVDDRRENLLAVEAVLEGLAVQIDSVTGGEEALKRLMTADYAVIVLDVHMPGMNGFETAEHIKGREKTRYIPMLFITAADYDAQSALRSYQAGAVDYIVKPFPPWLLRSKVEVFADLWTARAEVVAHSAQLAQTQRDLAVRDTRDEIAADVHDNTLQRLYALGLSMQMALDRATASPTGDRAASDAALADVTTVIDHGIEEIGSMIRELRNLILGLVATTASLRERLQDLVHDSTRTLGFSPALVLSGPLEHHLDDETATDLLEALREALSNIGRHARAQSASVRILASSESVELVVRDDGLGLPPNAVHRHGLTTIIDRAARHRGQANITTDDDGGTTLRWTVPARHGAHLDTPRRHHL